VTALKAELPGHLLSYGCGALANDLARHGLVDEVRFWLHPVVWGDGVRPFHAGDLPVRLRLIAATTFSAGRRAPGVRADRRAERRPPGVRDARLPRGPRAWDGRSGPTQGARMEHVGPTLVFVHGAWADNSAARAATRRAAYVAALLRSIEGPLRPVPYEDADGSAGVDLYLDAERFGEAFAGDVDPATARVMAATQRPFTEAAFGAPSGPVAWHAIPSWYLLGTEDRAIPPATQRHMAERAGATIVELPASHASMVSQPEAVTELILTAVEATAGTPTADGTA
jgi:pimeloyl-ACP methyl ester carboxylesterase